MNFYNLHCRYGFTLVEMLLVVAVIGILTAAMYVNLNDARQQSRDKLRQSQLKELQVALELYKDEHGRYPENGCSATPWTVAGGVWTGPGPTDGASWAMRCDTEYISGLVPEYMDELPTDPSQENQNGRGYYYATNPAGTAYKVRLVNTVESETVTYNHDFARCPYVPNSCRPSQPTNQVCGDPALGGMVEPFTYAVYSDGAECW